MPLGENFTGAETGALVCLAGVCIPKPGDFVRDARGE